MSSETNVYTINKKNMKNIYEKLYNACNHASGVKKASKVKGMPFNPLLHDDVQRVAMAALLENILICFSKSIPLLSNAFFTALSILIFLYPIVCLLVVFVHLLNLYNKKSD